MEYIWQLSAYNSEFIYVYGTEEKMRGYLDYLNKYRDVNLYEFEIVPDSEITDNIEYYAINLMED